MVCLIAVLGMVGDLTILRIFIDSPGPGGRARRNQCTFFAVWVHKVAGT